MMMMILLYVWIVVDWSMFGIRGGDGMEERRIQPNDGRQVMSSRTVGDSVGAR